MFSLDPERKALNNLKNYLKNDEEIELPKFCNFSVSNHCFFRCRICNVWRQPKNDKALTASEWIRIIDDLYGFLKTNAVRINFAGGEPLAFENIQAVINRAASYGFFTTICTNGYLLNLEMAHSLRDAGLRNIALSIDSLKPEKHNYFRNIGDSFEKAFSSIDYFEATDMPKVGFRTIISAFNLEDSIFLAEFVKKNGVLTNIDFQIISQPQGKAPIENWYKIPEYEWLWPKDKKKIEVIFSELIAMKNSGYPIENSVRQLESFKNYFLSPETFAFKGRKCRMETCYLNIVENGEVFLCHDLPRIGNIREKKLNELWYSYKAYKTRENIKGCRKNCYLLLNCCYESYDIK